MIKRSDTCIYCTARVSHRPRSDFIFPLWGPSPSFFPSTLCLLGHRATRERERLRSPDSWPPWGIVEAGAPTSPSRSRCLLVRMQAPWKMSFPPGDFCSACNRVFQLQRYVGFGSIIFRCGVCPVNRRMFISIPGLYLLGTSSTHSVTARNVPRHC